MIKAWIRMPTSYHFRIGSPCPDPSCPPRGFGTLPAAEILTLWASASPHHLVTFDIWSLRSLSWVSGIQPQTWSPLEEKTGPVPSSMMRSSNALADTSRAACSKRCWTHTEYEWIWSYKTSTVWSCCTACLAVLLAPQVLWTWWSCPATKTGSRDCHSTSCKISPPQISLRHVETIWILARFTCCALSILCR